MGTTVLSRRALLGCAAGAVAFAQNDADPLRALKPSHPRLLLPDTELERLRAAVKDIPAAHRFFLDLEKECDGLLSIPPVEYRLTGTRLQTQSRRAFDRISTLALMFRITGREAWLRRAVMELNAVANFHDWNPSRFIDTAELTAACAIGYDWLYNALSPDERTWLREALLTKGLEQALPIYRRQQWWTRERLNWNIVCNSAMGMAALAIGDESHDTASEILKSALESLPRGLTSWNADGSWPEGPAYGAISARYATLLFASLDNALGSDFGMSGFHGYDRTGRYQVYMTSPIGRFANFGDGPEEAGVAPHLFWMARRFTAPALAWQEQKQLEPKSSHPDALDLAWFDRDTRVPQGPNWPLDTLFHGTDVAVFRSAWDDSNALFLAVKAGDSRAPHSHLDLGSFIFDAGGIRWATDLSQDDAALVPAAPRGTAYRIRTESHNTLLIDGENQDLRADARVLHQDFSPELSFLQIDLSKTSPKLKQWTRRIGLAQRQAVMIEDSVRSDQPVDVLWSMTTDVEFSVSGPVATFHKNNWNMTAEIRSPRHAIFDTAAVKGPAGAHRKLIVRLPDKVTDLDLTIVLTPWRDGATKPKINAQFPA